MIIMQYRIEESLTKLPVERYINLLNKNPELFQKVFNKHIANYLGITPVSLSRIRKRIYERTK
jgi:FixJ family two-component response regulator